ncbi:MAG: acyl-ACP--UDP-N-acetylglucosamine O-acyltransferase [Pseudomonadota bacterium]
MTIHPTAIVEDGATLGDGVVIGPYAHVGPEVVLGDRVELFSHAVVAGRTKIGAETRIWPFASVGHQPQDLKYRGEPSRLEIGARCMIREHATLNPGTQGGGMLTRLGDGCLMMMGTHIGHDCQVGSGVIMANNATLAGHVSVGDNAVLGGLCAVHQHVRIGAHAMVGGMTGVERDVIPFGSVLGNRAHLGGLNAIGLRRRGFDRETIQALRSAVDRLFEDEGPMPERAERLRTAFPGIAAVAELADFVSADTQRRYCIPRERLVAEVAEA